MTSLITFTPVKTRVMRESFVLVDLLDDLIGGAIQNGDVLVISSKFVSMSEGRVVTLEGVRSGHEASGLSKLYELSPQLCELIVREADEIIGGVSGFVLAVKDGLLTPNAGIDKSNVMGGKVVLYPRNAAESAEIVVQTMKFRHGVDVGVVIADSRLMPTRRGTVGVAISAAGIQGILDIRGKPDLFGNILRVTSQAIADDLCSGAQILMGEADDGVPIVLVRGLKAKLIRDMTFSSKNFAISTQQCLYMRSLRDSKWKVLPAS